CGAVLLAAAEVGRGRGVAAGDSDLFALPFLSYNDNRALLIGLLSWLSGRDAAAVHPEPSVETAETAHDLVAHGLSADPAPAPGTVVELTAGERAAMAHLAAGVALDPLDPEMDFEAFDLEAKLAFHELPKRIRRALVEFAQRGNVDGA